jgi:hypothetical protein
VSPSLSFTDLVQIIWGIEGVAPAIIAGSLVAVVLGLLAARTFGGSRILACTTLIGEAILFSVTLVPDLRYWGMDGPGAWSMKARAGRSLEQCLQTTTSVTSAFTSMDGIANIVLFAGPAFLATLWLSRPGAAIVVLIVQSALIEALQAVVAGSACQVSDWVANAGGTVIGATLGIVVLKIASKAMASAR